MWGGNWEQGRRDLPGARSAKEGGEGRKEIILSGGNCSNTADTLHLGFAFYITSTTGKTARRWLSNLKPPNLQLPIALSCCTHHQIWMFLKLLPSSHPFLLVLMILPGANQLHPTGASQFQPNCCFQGWGDIPCPWPPDPTLVQHEMSMDSLDHHAAPQGADFLPSLPSITPTLKKAFKGIPHPPCDAAKVLQDPAVLRMSQDLRDWDSPRGDSSRISGAGRGSSGPREREQGRVCRAAG